MSDETPPDNGASATSWLAPTIRKFTSARRMIHIESASAALAGSLWFDVIGTKRRYGMVFACCFGPNAQTPASNILIPQWEATRDSLRIQYPDQAWSTGREHLDHGGHAVRRRTPPAPDVSPVRDRRLPGA